MSKLSIYKVEIKESKNELFKIPWILMYLCNFYLFWPSQLLE